MKCHPLLDGAQYLAVVIFPVNLYLKKITEVNGIKKNLKIKNLIIVRDKEREKNKTIQLYFGGFFICFFCLSLCFKSLIKTTSIPVGQKRNLVVGLYLEHLEIDSGGEVNRSHDQAPLTSHNTKELPTAPVCPRREFVDDGVKILHEVSIAISDRTNADPTWKIHTRRNCIISKPLDRGCWCLKTQLNIMQQNCDSTESGM